MAAALALFLIPVDRAKGEMVIDWATAVKLPWGVLILFGGGLALAAATEANGVAQYIGSLARGFSGWPLLAVVVTVIALMVFMSELTSNTAQVATMLPILAALAPVLGVPPALLLLPTTIAASCAFMMPVGTPPNAIVFGTGLVRMPQMMKAGFWLNLCGDPADHRHHLLHHRAAAAGLALIDGAGRYVRGGAHFSPEGGAAPAARG